MTIRIILAITGASGAVLGIHALKILHELKVETHLILSDAAKKTIEYETEWLIPAVESMAFRAYDPEDVGAALASGSFETQGMLVAPCSIKTLSAIANSYTADLITRSADVCLKEGRPLVLMVRETPFHLGHLRLMTSAAEMGAVIYPPIPVFYGHPQSVGDLVNATVGRALARLGLENNAYPRWKEKE